MVPAYVPPVMHIWLLSTTLIEKSTDRRNMNANSVNEKCWTALRNDALLFKVKALLVCGLTEDNDVMAHYFGVPDADACTS